jgi:hypothetical protein
MPADWDAGPVFITAEHAQISAEAMLRNFGPEASKICAELAAKWAARDDTRAQEVWRVIQKLVDRSFVAGDVRRVGYYGHIPRHAHQAP